MRKAGVRSGSRQHTSGHTVQILCVCVESEVFISGSLTLVSFFLIYFYFNFILEYS